MEMHGAQHPQQQQQPPPRLPFATVSTAGAAGDPRAYAPPLLEPAHPAAVCHAAGPHHAAPALNSQQQFLSPAVTSTASGLVTPAAAATSSTWQHHYGYERPAPPMYYDLQGHYTTAGATDFGAYTAATVVPPEPPQASHESYSELQHAGYSTYTPPTTSPTPTQPSPAAIQPGILEATTLAQYAGSAPHTPTQVAHHASGSQPAYMHHHQLESQMPSTSALRRPARPPALDVSTAALYTSPYASSSAYQHQPLSATSSYDYSATSTATSTPIQPAQYTAFHTSLHSLSRHPSVYTSSSGGTPGPTPASVYDTPLAGSALYALAAPTATTSSAPTAQLTSVSPPVRTRQTPVHALYAIGEPAEDEDEEDGEEFEGDENPAKAEVDRLRGMGSWEASENVAAGGGRAKRERSSDNEGYERETGWEADPAPLKHTTQSSMSPPPPPTAGPSKPKPPASGKAKAKRRHKLHHCQLCDKSFPRPSGLNTHMNTHRGIKRASSALRAPRTP